MTLETSTDSLVDVDPATGDTIVELPIASKREVVLAVQRASAARAGWAALPFAERARCLEAGGERLEARADEIARLATREMGKPLADAEREVRGCVRSLPSVLSEIERALEPEILRGKDSETRVEREALGVVAAITPWNFPIMMPIEILVPALGTGNAVVFKPSEHVPLTGAAVAECFADELPEDTLVTIQGAGKTGAALVAEEVDMIAFVGSRVTGKAIMERASSGLKRLVLELGGKDPLVVFDDADLDAAAECVVEHSLRNTGQVCCSVERVYVAAPVADEFERLVLEKPMSFIAASCDIGFLARSCAQPRTSSSKDSKGTALLMSSISAASLPLRGSPVRACHLALASPSR